MARLKEPEFNLLESIRKSAEDYEKNHPVLAKRYGVYEITPPTEDDYGSYVREEQRLVSPWFDTEQEAQDWTKKYEPDQGNHFKVIFQNLRSFTEKRWGV